MPRKKPIKSLPIRTKLIAPCGMNCRLCMAYTRAKNPCPGCRGDDSTKPKTRRTCRIKQCTERRQGNAGYCFTCNRFPCDQLDHLDQRYRTRYGMSMVDNLRYLKQYGVRRFIAHEQQQWTCPGCGDLLCVHKPRCLSCGYAWR